MLRTACALIGVAAAAFTRPLYCRSGGLEPPAAAVAARQFDALYAGVRDGQITRESARARVRELLPLIAADFHARGGSDAPKAFWRFPVAGYGSESIGGRNGSGYRPAGYDWFDGYESRGHPGHDIFIRDRNQDELDDGTGQPVDVVSISSGIVVAFAPEWTSGSRLRGGRYLCIYDPSQSGIFYYAHQRSLFVKPGDIVAPGAVIATVGRSGRNAAAPRSPTHLHVMFLAIENGNSPRPRNIYRDLVRLGRRRFTARGESLASHRDGRGASRARRDDREYREYLSEEQTQPARMHRPSNAARLSPRTVRPLKRLRRVATREYDRLSRTLGEPPL